MERPRPSRESMQAKVDIALGAVVGGIIGIVGAIAEINLVSSGNTDLDPKIIAAGATIVGVGLVANSVARFIEMRRLKKQAAPKRIIGDF